MPDVEDFRGNKQGWNTRRQIDRNTEVEDLIDAEVVTTTPHTAGDFPLILVDDDAVGGVATINLPLAASQKNYHIKKMGTTAFVVVDGNGSELIDGSATVTLAHQYDCLEIMAEGTGWAIV